MNEYKLLIDPFLYPIVQKEQQKVSPIYFGERSKKICIYCGKSSDITSFKKEAHVIPAALGNRTLFNYNECDHCNEHIFSSVENELANYLMLDRIFIGAKKRNGFPKFKASSKGNSSIEHSADSRTIILKVDETESKFEVIVDETKKLIKFIIDSPPSYSPASICKSLVHMIWPFLSLEIRQKLSHISTWLLGEVELLPLFLDITFVPGNGFDNVILECWESVDENSDFPLMVRFTFGLRIISFFIPASSIVCSEPMLFPNYIQLAEREEEIRVDRMKIISNGRLELENLSYTMKFDSASKLIKEMETE